eukprot:gene15162-biopygen10938
MEWPLPTPHLPKPMHGRERETQQAVEPIARSSSRLPTRCPNAHVLMMASQIPCNAGTGPRMGQRPRTPSCPRANPTTPQSPRVPVSVVPQHQSLRSTVTRNSLGPAFRSCTTRSRREMRCREAELMYGSGVVWNGRSQRPRSLQYANS